MRLPLIKARELLRFLEWLGFKPVRMKGSHVRLKAEDGRVTTVPIHGNKEIPRGLERSFDKTQIGLGG